MSQCFKQSCGNKKREISLRSCFAATSDHHVVVRNRSNLGKAIVIKPNKNRFFDFFVIIQILVKMERKLVEIFLPLKYGKGF